MEDYEISVQELSKRDADSYILIDIRDDSSYSYGNIPGSLHVPKDILEADYEKYKDKPLILYCKKGETSAETVQFLKEKNIEAKSLKGGYLAWLMESMKQEEEQQDVYLDIEQSIRKKFKKSIWCKFTKAVREYELVKEGDKIAVCISGGKDSMLMAKLFQELQRHGKFPFELVFLVMDPGYSPENRAIIESNAKLLQIPITVFETNIFNSVYNVENNPCYLCARMRRGHLYHQAEVLGCNKIALGHHFDDVIETILMSMIYGGQVETMMPKLHSANFPGMQLIRPMYLIREADIKHWCSYHNLRFIQCACRFTDTCTTCNPSSNTSSKRQKIKQLIAELAQDNPQIEKNIFRSVENIHLNKIISYQQNKQFHSFLDDYDNHPEKPKE